MLNGTNRMPGENGKDYAYRVIRKNIMNLTLEPGKAISEIDLAAALQLSRTPVREVMSRLKEEYLVDVIPQVGTYISKIDPQLIDEAVFMRFALEKEVVLLACNRFSAEDLLALRHNVEKQESLQQNQGGASKFHELDNEFHSLLFQGCGKEHVWASITRLSTHYNRMRLMFEIEYDFTQAIEQHRSLIELIAEQRVDDVESAVHRHIIEPMSRWTKLQM